MAGWCPFYDEHGIRLLTDRSTEFWGPRTGPSPSGWSFGSNRRRRSIGHEYGALPCREDVGNGRTVPLLIEQANALTYAGVEIAETLLGEARPAVGNPKMY